MDANNKGDQAGGNRPVREANGSDDREPGAVVEILGFDGARHRVALNRNVHRYREGEGVTLNVDASQCRTGDILVLEANVEIAGVVL